MCLCFAHAFVRKWFHSVLRGSLADSRVFWVHRSWVFSGGYINATVELLAYIFCRSIRPNDRQSTLPFSVFFLTTPVATTPGVLPWVIGNGGGDVTVLRQGERTIEKGRERVSAWGGCGGARHSERQRVKFWTGRGMGRGDDLERETWISDEWGDKRIGEGEMEDGCCRMGGCQD